MPPTSRYHFHQSINKHLNAHTSKVDLQRTRVLRKRRRQCLASFCSDIIVCTSISQQLQPNARETIPHHETSTTTQALHAHALCLFDHPIPPPSCPKPPGILSINPSTSISTHTPLRLIFNKPECCASADTTSAHPSAPIPLSAHESVNSCNQTHAKPSHITGIQPRHRRFTRMPGAFLTIPSAPSLFLPQTSRYPFHQQAHTSKVDLQQARMLRQRRRQCLASICSYSVPCKSISQQLQPNARKTIPHHETSTTTQALHAHATCLFNYTTPPPPPFIHAPNLPVSFPSTSISTHTPLRLIFCKPECCASADANVLHPSAPIPLSAHESVNSCNRMHAKPSHITRLQSRSKRFTRMPCTQTLILPRPLSPATLLLNKHLCITTHVLSRLIFCKPECFASADTNVLHPSAPILFPANQSVNSCNQMHAIPSHITRLQP
jgi:hypothetical protein